MTDIACKFGIHAINDLHAGDGIPTQSIEILVRVDGVIAKDFRPDFCNPVCRGVCCPGCFMKVWRLRN